MTAWALELMEALAKQMNNRYKHVYITLYPTASSKSTQLYNHWDLENFTYILNYSFKQALKSVLDKVRETLFNVYFFWFVFVFNSQLLSHHLLTGLTSFHAVLIP